MAKAYGVYGPSHPRLGALAFRLGLPLARVVMWSRGFHRPDGKYARARARAMQEKLSRGEPVYLLGIGVGSHNAGVSLAEVTRDGGVRLLCNNEEERYSGVKHYGGFPEGALDDLLVQMDQWDVKPADIHACVTGFDHAVFLAAGLRSVMEEFPGSLSLLRSDASPEIDRRDFKHLAAAPSRLARQLGIGKNVPIIGMRHHDNHAYFSHAASPFARSTEPVIITVIDGNGDDSSISLYLARNGRLRLLESNRSLAESLGGLYRMLSSTQGGWTPLSSEGRYMGATAWGNNDRLTNPYYRQLRQLIYFAGDGKVFLNRALADWHRKRYIEPYTEALREIVGAPIRYRDMWNPDAVLKLDESLGDGMAQDRLDKAAAVQMLFEDALFHMIERLIRVTGSSRLVLTGGTALNCVANMRLLDHFDEAYFERYLGKPGVRLHIWVPPVPSDTGIPAGAAFNYALSNGAPPGESIKHAFYCGSEPTGSAIRSALKAEPEIDFMTLNGSMKMVDVADLIAALVSREAIIGIYQGVAETGPRALGHRSILANPCNPSTLDHLNARVKFREPFRPLAPIVTYEAAQELFELSPGASDDDHNAYNYMVLTAKVRSGARRRVPAVVHKDRTSRLQIARQETDPFTHAYLKAMGRRNGEEVSVNTSLNVGSPIVQTPGQALGTLKRAKGMDGLLLLGDQGEAYLAWHDIEGGLKDGGRALRTGVESWKPAPK